MTKPEIRHAYQEHKDAIYRFAWRMTGSAASAEDIVQEYFLSVLRNPDGYDGSRAPMRPFLLAIARNLVRKRWRSEQRWDALEEETFVAEPMDPAVDSGRWFLHVGCLIRANCGGNLRLECRTILPAQAEY